MSPDGQSFNGKNLAIYLVAGLLLIGVVIGGVVWAKNRAQQIASQPSPVATNTPEASNPESNPPSPTTEPSKSQADQNQTSQGVGQIDGSFEAAQTGSAEVPATGASDWLVVVIILAGLTFVTISYLRSVARSLPERQ